MQHSTLAAACNLLLHILHGVQINVTYVPQFVITCLIFWDGLTSFIAVNFRYPVTPKLKRGDKVNVA